MLEILLLMLILFPVRERSMNLLLGSIIEIFKVGVGIIKRRVIQKTGCFAPKWANFCELSDLIVPLIRYM